MTPRTSAVVLKEHLSPLAQETDGRKTASLGNDYSLARESCRFPRMCPLCLVYSQRASLAEAPRGSLSSVQPRGPECGSLDISGRVETARTGRPKN